MKKADYLEYIGKTLERGRSLYGESIENWRKAYEPDKFLGSYVAPGIIPVMAHLEAFMHQATGGREYARRAREHLLEIGSYRSIVPEEQRRRHPEYEKDIPAMEACFQSPHYTYGYKYMKDAGLLSPEECAEIDRCIASSIRSAMHYPEWGAHNRSMLRVWATVLASSVVEPTEEWAYWNKLADHMALDSFGGWSIEDAQAYMDLWLLATMEYARYRDREQEYYALPQTRYYFDFIARLITPYGQVPDFGDTNFNATWYIWIPILEKGASVYRDGHMKYAAGKLFEFAMKAEQDPLAPLYGSFLALACQWADDSVEPVRPSWGSGDALDDLVGKKIVFRSGWEDHDTYLLLNYRDEGPYGRTARKYLRTTISVKAEKMHHGHSDENAVVLLAAGGNVLLHEGGYREMAPNGKYRADLYHNRLVFRQGELPAAAAAAQAADAGSGETSYMYDALHDDGSYKFVETERVHFHAFERLDYSRTRVRDPHRRLVWDRLVTFLRDENVFLIADWVQSEADQTLTAANLWHTHDVERLGPGALRTRIPFIHRRPGCRDPYRNREDKALLIEFPGSQRRIGWERIRRNYGDAAMIYEAESRTFRKGETACFVTVLTPVDAGESPQGRLGRAKVALLTERHDLLCLTYAGNRETTLAYKLDLDKGLKSEAETGGDALRYDWESGKMNYGGIVTDADFAFVERGQERTAYGFLNGTALYDGEKRLFSVPKYSTYDFETKEWKPAASKWRSWEDEEEIRK